MSSAALEQAIRDGHLPALIRDLADGGAADRWLGRALRRDLALLTERPELLLPCVYRTTLGSDAELTSILHDWEASHDRPWLRALRPPEVPLDSGLVEEYRGGQGQVAFSADGATLGFVGQRAWDRATGAPTSPTGLVGQRQLELWGWAGNWGKLYLLREGRTYCFEVDGDTSFSQALDGPEGTVIAAGWFGDYEGMVVRLAVADGSVLWRTEFAWNVEHLSVGKRFVAVGSGDRVVLLDLATGQPARTSFVPMGASTAWSPDGELLAVKRSAGAIQVWSTERLLDSSHLTTRPRATSGFVPAQFSCDGKILLTGALLCDGLTGEVLAELDVDGPGYLEGGPARGARRVLPDGFIESAPLRGLRRWDTRGELVLEDRDRRYHAPQVMAFSEDGTCYGVARELGAEVVVRRVLDGSLVGTSPSPGDQFEVTPSGEVRAPLPRRAPFTLRPRESPTGLCELVDARGQAIAAIPAEGPLVPSPDGLRWAWRTEHYVLEGLLQRD
jgi:hypothetical protein